MTRNIYKKDVCHDFHSFYILLCFSPAINIVPIHYDDGGGDAGGDDGDDDLMIMMVVMMVMITVLLPSLLLSSPIIAVISRMSNQRSLI